MARTEDGEFELVLGNKQLLSVFFIIVILLGVFFTMGYIVGRNSAPMSASADRPSTATPVTPRPDAMPPAESTSAGPASSNSPAAEPNGPAVSPEPPAAEFPAPREPSAASTRVLTPEPGQMFVQVSSMLEQPAAEILVDVLGKKGFRSIIAPGPNDGRFRVLVGPVKDATDAGRVRSDLEAAGFRGAFVKKY